MPPKAKYTKEQLIDVAFDIANEEGFQNITIRKIADRLNCSIAPIYVNFKDVVELKNEVILKTIRITEELLAEQNSGEPFLDIGIASVLFAKKYPLLFDEFGIRHNEQFMKLKGKDNLALNQMKKAPELQDFTREELQGLLLKMQAFQAGLSILARNPRFAEILTDDVIIQLLDETGDDVVNGIKRRKENKKG